MCRQPRFPPLPKSYAGGFLLLGQILLSCILTFSNIREALLHDRNLPYRTVQHTSYDKIQQPPYHGNHVQRPKQGRLRLVSNPTGSFIKKFPVENGCAQKVILRICQSLGYFFQSMDFCRLKTDNRLTDRNVVGTCNIPWLQDWGSYLLLSKDIAR